MQPDHNVSDMVNEVLMRQARARAARTGERLEESLDAILETEAGSQLRRLREGAHRDERADDWQEGLARKRAAERE
jgi:hypothetical protein